MPLAELGHFGLFCRDMELCTRFYRDVMGLTVTDEDMDLGIRFFSARPNFEHHEFQLIRGRTVPDAREGKRPLTLVRDFVSGQHRQHTRLLPGSRGLDPPDVSMGVRAAEHGHIRHAAELHVPGICPCAGEEAGVFFALDGGANQCGSLA